MGAVKKLEKAEPQIEARKKSDLEPLTERQEQIITVIENGVILEGRPPAVREIGLRCKPPIKSPNGVMCHLKALEKKGYIDRASHTSRGILLTFGNWPWLKKKAPEKTPESNSKKAGKKTPRSKRKR